jgi:hypothetical protein
VLLGPIVRRETLMSTLFGSTSSGNSVMYAELAANTNLEAREVAREESRAVAKEVVNQRLRALLDTIREAVDR